MKMQASSRIHLCVLMISIIFGLFAICYQPLPDDFPQPWKYRFLSYWAQKSDQFVNEANLFFQKEKLKMTISRQEFVRNGISLLE